jgi:PAS domain S-box-containing protein
LHPARPAHTLTERIFRNAAISSVTVLKSGEVDVADGDPAHPESEPQQLRQRLEALEAENERLRLQAGPSAAPSEALPDVNDHARAVEALRKQVAFSHSLIHTAAEGICVCRPIPEFPFVAFSVWNERMTELTGYTMEEINRLGWYQTVYPDPEVQARAVERMIRMRDGDDIIREEWTITRKDGQPRTLVISTSRVETDEGPAAVAVMHDVTERNRAAEERRRLEEKLQQAKQLESLGVLAEGVAHDFNNLLTAILGYSSLAEAQVPSSSPAREYLLHVERSARRAAELCRQMLAFAGKGTVLPEPTDLSDVARETAMLLRPSLSPKAEWTLDLAVGMPAVLADPTQLRQVVLGLLSNASEALEENAGRIRVTTRVERLGRERLASLRLGENLPEGDYALLEVADTGKGMDDALQARIFEPFFSTKFTGRGLGLAAVLGIVRRHRGALEVLSRPGESSTFRLWFPLAATTARGQPQPTAASLQPPVASGRLLLAEDEDHVRALAGLILREMGFEVTEARDGQEALDLLAAGAGSFRLALLDLTMPAVDGLTVARRLRQMSPQLPVVLMSGYNVGDLVEQGVGLSPASFLQKPFSLEALRSALLAALSQPGDQ